MKKRRWRPRMKALRLLAAVLVFTAVLSLAAGAVDELGDFGMAQAGAALPQEAAAQLAGAEDAASVMEGFSLGAVLDFVSNHTYSIVRGALADLARILAVVLIFVVIQGMMSAVEKKFVHVAFDFAAMLVAALVLYDSMGEALGEAMEAVRELSVYIKALLPVFAGTLTVTGAPVSGAVLPGIALAVVNLLSGLNTSFFLPMIQVYLAVCLAGGISEKVSLAGLAGLVKSAVTWCLTAVCTIFVSVLSVQRLITGASDGVAAKTAKLAMSSFVPVVGGIVKDALDTVAGSILVIRSVAGALGVAAIFYVLVPVFIRLFLYAMVFRISAAFAGLGGKSRLYEFLRAASEVWNIIFAVTACEGLLFVLGIAVMMTVGGA